MEFAMAWEIGVRKESRGIGSREFGEFKGSNKVVQGQGAAALKGM